MSKSEQKAAAPKAAAILNTSARGAIVRAFTDAFDNAENTGSMVTHVCNVAAKFINGPLIDDDYAAVVNGVAQARGWKGPSLKARASEVRTILSTHEQLPSAIDQFKARMGVCNWHQAVRLGREIRKADGNVSKAVNSAVKSAKSGGQSKGSTPQGRTAAALKAWFKSAKSDKRDLILKAAQMLGLKLGLKVEA